VVIVVGVSVEGGKWLEKVILHICLFAEAVASADRDYFNPMWIIDASGNK
jgi:hypothetical protein